MPGATARSRPSHAAERALRQTRTRCHVSSLIQEMVRAAAAHPGHERVGVAEPQPVGHGVLVLQERGRHCARPVTRCSSTRAPSSTS